MTNFRSLRSRKKKLQGVFIGLVVGSQIGLFVASSIGTEFCPKLSPEVVSFEKLCRKKTDLPKLQTTTRSNSLKVNATMRSQCEFHDACHGDKLCSKKEWGKSKGWSGWMNE